MLVWFSYHLWIEDKNQNLGILLPQEKESKIIVEV